MNTQTTQTAQTARTTDPTALAETVEAEVMYQYETQAPKAAQEGLGLATTRMGGGVVLSARLDPYAYWSKALGLGITEPVTPELIDGVINFYREQQTPTALIQLAPSVLPPDWDEIRAAHALEPVSSWLKLATPITDLRTDAVTDLRVARVEEADALEWATVVARAFGMDNPALIGMLTQSVHDPASQLFAAWDGKEIVAGGGLYLRGTTASLHSGATAPTHRGRGAQSALIAARIEAARAAGALWVVSETGKAAPGEHNPSTKNMLRAGLRVAYVRQNWRWRA